MLKCAPYIKNLCSSLQSGLWKDQQNLPSSSNNLPSSLPGSPIRRGQHRKQQASPTRSEGGGVPEDQVHHYKKPQHGLEAVSMPVLVAKITDKEGEVITTAVKGSDFLSKVNRPESPDVTRPAKKLENQQLLGAISKVRLLKNNSSLTIAAESPTTSTASSSSLSPK